MLEISVLIGGYMIIMLFVSINDFKVIIITGKVALAPVNVIFYYVVSLLVNG